MMNKEYLKVASEKMLACRNDQYSENSFRNAIAVTIPALDATDGAWDEIAKRWPKRGFTRERFSNWSQSQEPLPDAPERQAIIIRLQNRIDSMIHGRSFSNQSFSNLPQVGATWERSGKSDQVTFFGATPETVTGAKVPDFVKRPVSQPKLPIVEALQEVSKDPSKLKSSKPPVQDPELKYREAMDLHQELCTWRSDPGSMRQCAISFTSIFGEKELAKITQGSGIAFEKISAWLVQDSQNTTFIFTFRREFMERLTIFVTLWLMDEGKMNSARWSSIIETARRVLGAEEMNNFLAQTKSSRTELSVWSRFFGKRDEEIAQEKTPDAQVIYRVTRHLKEVLTKRLEAPWEASSNKPAPPRA